MYSKDSISNILNIYIVLKNTLNARNIVNRFIFSLKLTHNKFISLKKNLNMKGSSLAFYLQRVKHLLS